MLDWNRDRWYRSRISSRDEGAREVGINWESVRRRCRVASSWVMGSEISRKWREDRDRREEDTAGERREIKISEQISPVARPQTLSCLSWQCMIVCKGGLGTRSLN